MFNTYLNIAHFISLFLHASLYKHNSLFAFLTGHARLCDILPIPGVVNGGISPPLSPVAPASPHRLPAPLAGGVALAAQPPILLSLNLSQVEGITLAAPAVSRDVPATAALPRDAGVSIPTWLAQVEAGSLPSESSDNGRPMLFAPGVMPSAYGSTPLTVKPILSARNLMTIARNAYGRGQAGQLVPALLSGFETELSYWDIHERLRLLWLMRKDVATLVWAMIIVGQAWGDIVGAP